MFLILGESFIYPSSNVETFDQMINFTFTTVENYQQLARNSFKCQLGGVLYPTSILSNQRFNCFMNITFEKNLTLWFIDDFFTWKMSKNYLTLKHFGLNSYSQYFL
jgi:hypothetical protein